MHLDTLVIGGGLCGALAADHLARAGQRTLTLEAGPAPRRRLPGDHPGFLRATKPLTSVDPRRWRYRGPKGYAWHRVRALGGRTLLWGGWMMRPRPDYFRWRRALGAGWPRELEQLAPWVALAERRLHVMTGARGRVHRRLAALGVDALAKREAVLPGGSRMLTAADLPLRAVRQATALSFEPSARGVAVHLAGGAVLEARSLVLAASPVETARIVEASRGSRARARLPYADHLLAGAICIVPRQPARSHPVGRPDFSAVVAPRPHDELRFTLEIRGPTPLERLDADDLAELGFSAETAASRSFYVVFAMGETDPLRPRTVELDARERDALGRAVPSFVRRRHTDWEQRLAKQMNSECMRIAERLGEGAADVYSIYDANDFGSGGHETGTCLDLVDADGRLRELPDVFVADGAGVPGATDGHPSLTLAANALRVAAAALRHHGS